MADRYTRQDSYIASLAGLYEGSLPEPITRYESYLYCLCTGGDPKKLRPAIARREKYIANLLGLTPKIPTPITRKDRLWAAICGGSTKPPRKPITQQEILLSAIYLDYSAGAVERDYQRHYGILSEWDDPFADSADFPSHINIHTANDLLFCRMMPKKNRVYLEIVTGIGIDGEAGHCDVERVIFSPAECGYIFPTPEKDSYAEFGRNVLIGINTAGEIVCKPKNPNNRMHYAGRHTGFVYSTAKRGDSQ